MLGALILIDIQEGFDDPFWGTRNNLDAESNAGRLLTHWRAHSAPVFHIQHLSTTAGSPLNPDGGLVALKSMVSPREGEPVLTKHVNSAFIGTNLEKRLRKLDVVDVTICGLTTPHCVSTTTRMAANLGFKVRLVHDACAAFTGNADSSWRNETPPNAAQIHEAALDQLHGEFAQVLSTDQVLG
ncbi:cysteine hydrolase family protein [Aliiroseovarius sp. F20344]|uniref:cysteine hydrolase family protein n=1 Tax=Aliiroseovarius sp. F20344 TaxID=2926414 RepID=UPI001FF6AC70|nr:cysteine hydrolase family protein [Aliiroseovarius sp. F20344]MCK0142482.1 cysteine hydrolase [Aliiroseovarius sp. F20344]